jgi:hypothetical protein
MMNLRPMLTGVTRTALLWGPPVGDDGVTAALFVAPGAATMMSAAIGTLDRCQSARFFLTL